MVSSNGLRAVRVSRALNHDVNVQAKKHGQILKRDTNPLSALGSLLDPSAAGSSPATTGASSEPSTAVASSPAASKTASSSSASGSNDGSESGSSNTGSTTSSVSSSSKGGNSEANGGAGSSEVQSATDATQATNAATSAVAISTAPASPDSAAAASSAAASAAIATAVTVVTDSNGLLTTSTISPSTVPSTNLIGASTSSSSSLPYLGSATTSGSGNNAAQTGNNALSNASSSSSDSNRKTIAIAVPIAIVAGILLIGLIVSMLMNRHKRWMERQLWTTPAVAADERRSRAYRRPTTRMMFGAGRRGSHYDLATSVGHDHPGAYANMTSDDHDEAAAFPAAAGIYGARRHQSHSSIRQAIRSGEFEYDEASSYGEHTQMSHGPHVQPVSYGGRPNASVIDEDHAGETHVDRESDTHGHGIDSIAADTAFENVASHNDAGWDGSAAQVYTQGATQRPDAIVPRTSPGISEISKPETDEAYGGAELFSNYNSKPFDYRAVEENSRPNPNYDGNDRRPIVSSSNGNNRASRVRSILSNPRWSRK